VTEAVAPENFTSSECQILSTVIRQWLAKGRLRDLLMSPLDPTDRRELYEHFQHVIGGTYDQLLEEQKLNYKQNMLKSFLVESNINPDTLEEKFEHVTVGKVDYSLFEVLVNTSSDEDEEEFLTFYLDSQDERFWTFYSIEKSRPAKDSMEDLIMSERSGLDYLWFPAQLQRYFTTLGEFQGAGINYDAEEVFSEEYIEDYLPFGELSIQSSGRGTSWLLDALSEAELKRFMSLSSVKIRQEMDDGVVIERIDNNGRITTRAGDDIQAHLSFVETIRELYANLIRGIEEEGRIGYPIREIESKEGERHSSGQSIEGTPIVINLANSIDSLKQFADSFTSATKPLRLWGVGSWLADDYYKVRGTDLHNNDSFTLEIKRDWIRLYLPDDACGNTALRIFSNIQRYYDAEASFGERSDPKNSKVGLTA